MSEFHRDYSRASSLLAETRAEGDRIIVEAGKRKEEAKAAALQEKEQAEEAVHGVRELVERVEQAGARSVAQSKAKAVREKSHKLQSEVQDRAPKPGP